MKRGDVPFVLRRFRKIAGRELDVGSIVCTGRELDFWFFVCAGRELGFRAFRSADR